MFSQTVVGDVTPRKKLNSCIGNINFLPTPRSKLKSQPSAGGVCAECFLSISRLLLLALKDPDTAFIS